MKQIHSGQYLDQRRVVPGSIFCFSSAREIVLTEFSIRATLNDSFIAQGASELLDTDGDKYRRVQCGLRKVAAAVILQFNFS